ncbi:helix-turn-helix domain-containing protein [Staphylococcus saprophyticus]|nr:helix-turn-helix domain-containing protein [Staphylococcus saprophyticus]MDW4483774.1 helix-turn-helix domain-containing protein [Staphylococcus saprophyticus]
MKTVKEVSEVLDVSKQTIHYHLKNLPSNFKVKKVGNKTLIDDEIIAYLESLPIKKTSKESSNKSAKFDKKTSNKKTSKTTAIEDYIDNYIAHLESEIRQKNRQIDDLTIALKQEQSLNLNSQNILSNNEKIETEITEEKEDIVMPNKTTQNEQKQSLFSKLFKKK